MHELVFAEEILDTVLSAAQQHGAGRVKRVTLHVGRFSGIDASSLLFCLESIASDTPMENAVIDVEEITAPSVCLQCGSTEQDDTTPGICPNCGAPLDWELQSELRIQEIELDDED
jgi:hydrogenase nickel insertion protein HypA